MWKIREFLWDHPDFKFGLRILLILLLAGGFGILVGVITPHIPKPTYSIILVDAQGKTIFEQSGTDKITVLSTSDNNVQLSTKGKTYTFENATIKEASNNIATPSDPYKHLSNLIWLLFLSFMAIMGLIALIIALRSKKD